MLTFSGSLRAEILVSIPNVPEGNSTLPGYENWIKLDRMQISIDNPISESEETGGTEDINIGIGQIDQFHLSKPTGVASAHLFRHAINGNSVGDVQIRVVDVRPGGIAPTTAWKFNRAFVASYSIESIDGVLVDQFSLYFNKIAFAVVIEEEVSAFGWDRTRQAAWIDHGLESDLQSELSRAANLIPGDFVEDGTVDGGDFLAWQRGQSPSALGASDLADWQRHFGEIRALVGAATPVPEHSGSVALLLALLFGMLRQPFRWRSERTDASTRPSESPVSPNHKRTIPTVC